MHSFSHEDDDCNEKTPCEVCNYAITHNFTPEITTELQDFSIENTTLLINNIVINYYNFKVLNSIASNQLFSRPPPVNKFLFSENL
ncbi:MAG: hypothetical protein ABJG40_12040 [Polaribacter sp.]|uniref:hypothetical protein n=1 Tax=Polaribacter sp. TaxID=1920175 RepID=UPI003265D13C